MYNRPTYSPPLSLLISSSYLSIHPRLMSREASSSRSLRCFAWIILRSGSVRCILVRFLAVFFRSSIFTWFSTFAGFMNLVRFSFDSGFTFVVFGPLTLESFSTFKFCRPTFSQCSSYDLIHFLTISFARWPTPLTFVWLMHNFLILFFSPFLPWLPFQAFPSSNRVNSEHNPNQ